MSDQPTCCNSKKEKQPRQWSRINDLIEFLFTIYLQLNKTFYIKQKYGVKFEIMPCALLYYFAIT